jgi:hypothetical protein
MGKDEGSGHDLIAVISWYLPEPREKYKTPQSIQLVSCPRGQYLLTNLLV